MSILFHFDFKRKTDYKSKKKKFVSEEMAKFSHIFDTKDFILCVVYNKIVNKKLFENLNDKF